MTNPSHSPLHGEGQERVATLVRSVPVRLVEISRGGCRLECNSRIEAGMSGQLAVGLQGLMRIDDVRIARCQQRMGAGPVYQVGAELLRTKPLARRSVRMAVRGLTSALTAGGIMSENGGDAPSAEDEPGSTGRECT